MARRRLTARSRSQALDLSIPDQKAPPLSNISGNIKLAGTSADVGPVTFNLGAQQATLKSHIDQFQPLVMSYELNAAAVRLADLAPSRPPDEVINQLFAKGAVAIGSDDRLRRRF